MRSLHPPLDTAQAGHLGVGQGHEIYYEECGNRAGLPVVFLHGGPGSAINAQHRRFFDPTVFRIILFDQRGCGRSRPRGEVQSNTTQDLVDDMERLRIHLGIDRWALFGGSWGSTLALCYALAHGTRVSGLILRGVFLGSDDELRWYCEGLRGFVPEAWERLTKDIPMPRTDTILAHYGAALMGANAARAASEWSVYESAVMAIGETPSGGTLADGAALTDRARVQLHYLCKGCFLPTLLLDRVAELEMPALIVQGRRDLVCPPITAHAVHQRLAGSELEVVEAGGHSAMHPAMIDALVRAVSRMAQRLESCP